ncbi:putative manganese transporter [Clostridium cylindrosporum]|nr:putative manganese transporter [Clostridium cylindrosporum]
MNLNLVEHSHEIHEGHLHTEGVSIFSVIEHAFIDTLPMIPILIITFIMIEYMEHRFSAGLQEKIRNAGVLGPIVGALIGIIPQCGFSVMAVALYSRKIVSLGTLISIFIATSDEALPVFLSMPSAYGSIMPFLITKIAIAIVAGYFIDVVTIRRSQRCEIAASKEVDDQALKCVDVDTIKFSKVLIHSLERTLKVTIYIYIVTVIITFIIEYFGVETLAGTLFSEGYGQVFIASLIGLIPNCAISVGLVKLFTMNVIGFSSVIAGLSANAGLALIFLFKENKKKAVYITLILFGISFLSGVVIKVMGIYS